MEGKKNKKIDYEALNSSFMRIPKMDVVTVRNFINLGYSEVFQLNGVCPEVLFEAICKKNKDTPKEVLYKIRMAVYFAENLNPDPKMLNPLAWKD